MSRLDVFRRDILNTYEKLGRFFDYRHQQMATTALYSQLLAGKCLPGDRQQELVVRENEDDQEDYSSTHGAARCVARLCSVFSVEDLG